MIWKVLSPSLAARILSLTSAAFAADLASELQPLIDAHDGQVADGRTIAGFEAAMPLHIASTTKIMTAWLIVRLSDESAEVLDEMLTMSSRADDTRGSRAGVRAGETLTVREALFGLLLPSGNDMSVALAEHFGARLHSAANSRGVQPASVAADADPLIGFVAAMNAEAMRLGMKQTHFTNPHGLTNREHVSTVSDLAILARATLGSELFRRYASTRQRGATVTGPGGYSRNIVWKNTNELPGTEGYDGIKTGTTEQAGACLVSTGQREGRRLIVVVLGAAASESRYTDTRNLYRWAWNQLREAGK